MTWLLLIYSVPAHPSRKRAAIWREVKRVGAVYLRDGVCVLPEQEETVAAARAIAEKVREFDGAATIVRGARIDDPSAETVIVQSRTARAVEYGEIAGDAEGFLDHVRRETEHRAFTFAELEELEGDLQKLKRWYGQVHARDYFGSPEREAVDAALARCDEALATFLENNEAYRNDEATG
jgi:hypothetical protein